MFFFCSNMSDTQTLDQDEVMLARIAELDLSLAEKLHACAMAAEDPAEIASLARAYQKAARSLRQSLALKAKLKRDLANDARDETNRRERERSRQVHHRRSRIEAAVSHLIWNEAENEREAEKLDSELSDLLDIEALGEDFLTEPLEIQIIRLCKALEINPPQAEPAEAPGAPPQLQSSG
jgi:hypothetical protein